MKTIKTTSKYLLLALLVAFSFSCTPEDGADGATGPAGINGIDGIDGEDGNANVIIKTAETISWTEGSYLGKTSNYFEISDTDIDQNIIDNGLVIVYFQLFSEGTWHPMTFNFPFSGGDEQVITFTHSLNKLTIYSLDSDDSLNAGISKIKYFIIDSSI